MDMHMDAGAPTTPSSAIVPVMTGGNSEAQTTDEQSNKRRRKKSIVWEHFTIETVGAGCMRACCKQCKKSFAYITGSKLAGTSHLKRHIALGICPVSRQRNDQSSSTPGTKSEPPKKRYRASPGWPAIPFDQDRCTQEIAKMIIQHDYPLNIVEHPAFVEFVRTLHPQYNMVSFNSIQGEIVALYLREKQNLLNIISGIPGRVSLSLDLGMSNQSIGYAFLMGHFADADWNLHCRLLNVVMLPFPDSEYAFNQAVVSCLSDWHLENKLFTLTLDQSFANETMIGNLRGLLAVRNPFTLNAQLLKGNCYARVLSRLAQDALGSMGDTIRRIRESVKYVKTSDAHDEKFNELRQQLQVPSTKELIIDDQSKWNTTYHMLVAACELKEVFACLDTSDPVYKINPSIEDWKQVEVLCTYLKLFYEAANVLTARPYPPANVFYHEVSKIQLELTHASMSLDPFVINLTKPLKEKFDKYWRECFLILAVAVVMDPRFKMKLVEFSFSRIFGEDAGMWIKIVDDGIHELFEDYLIPPHLRLPGYGEGQDVMNLHLHGHHDGYSQEAHPHEIHTQETGIQVMNSQEPPSDVHYQEVHHHEMALQEMQHSEFDPQGMTQEVHLHEAIRQETNTQGAPGQEMQTSEAPPSQKIQTSETPPSQLVQTSEAPPSQELQTSEAPSQQMQTSETHPQKMESQDAPTQGAAPEGMDNKEVLPPEKMDTQKAAPEAMEIEKAPDQETNTLEAHIQQMNDQDTAPQEEVDTHVAASQQMNEQEGTSQEGLSEEVPPQEKEAVPQEMNVQELAPQEMNGQEAAPQEKNTEEVPQETQKEEAPVQAMQDKEAAGQEMQNEEAPVQEIQNEEAPIKEMQNKVTPVQETQNEVAPVQETQNEEVPSDEVNNEEVTPGEMQNQKAPSGELQNEAVPPGEMQNERASSGEVQNEKTPSGEMQKEEMPAAQDLSPQERNGQEAPLQEVNTHETLREEIPSQETVHEEMQSQEAADQEMDPQEAPSQEMHNQGFLPEEVESQEHPQELLTREVPTEEMHTQEVPPEEMQGQEHLQQLHAQEMTTEEMHSQGLPQEMNIDQAQHQELQAQIMSQEAADDQEMHPQEAPSQEMHNQGFLPEEMQIQERPQELLTQKVPTEEMHTQEVSQEEMQGQEHPQELHTQEVPTEEMHSQGLPQEMNIDEAQQQEMQAQVMSQDMHPQMLSREIKHEDMNTHVLSQEMKHEDMHTQDLPLLSIGDGLSDFDVYISEITSGQHKSELDQYLEESLLPRVQDFDVLGWWKLNKMKYPTLSKLAADILSIPVSTVAPESVFDTQNKKIDNYHSSLRPVTLEALVCAKDWLQYGSSSTLSSHDASNAL